MSDRPAQVPPAPDPRELARQVAELRAAVRARDDFLAIVAHELRNAMTPITAGADLALKAARDAPEACSPRVTMLLERLQGLAENFTQRSIHLLEFGRIDAGNLKLDLSRVDLSAVVTVVTDTYEVEAERARSRLDLDLQHGVIAVVDRFGIAQVIENLLSNALKFGMGNPVTLRLRADPQAVRLDVQDRGVGLSVDHQGRIFGRFEQIMARHRGSGFGVGLWIAQRLTIAMGGRITVSSRLGEGSVFTVTLPPAPPESDRKNL